MSGDRMATKKYYAVKVGKNPGIYETWDEAKENVIGFIGAIYKSFSKYDDAVSFMNGIEKEVTSINPFVYVDGSFDASTNAYSFGAVLVSNGVETRFKKSFPADEYSIHRNVAGEIKGAGFVINYCINQGISEIDLYYDYIGIEKWFTGEWKARKPISMVYQEFANTVKDKIKVNFIKVKSHSNVYYNDLVDLLAKEALGIS